MTREEALARLRAQVRDGRPIIGAGAGTGLSAKCAEAGGADLVIIYNSGRYRMAGRGSLAGLLPYGDANAIVLEMAGEGAAPGHPIAAGVVDDDQVGAARFGALGGQARAGARADDGAPGLDLRPQARQRFFAGHPALAAAQAW